MKRPTTYKVKSLNILMICMITLTTLGVAQIANDLYNIEIENDEIFCVHADLDYICYHSYPIFKNQGQMIKYYLPSIK